MKVQAVKAETIQCILQDANQEAILPCTALQEAEASKATVQAAVLWAVPRIQTCVKILRKIHGTADDKRPLLAVIAKVEQ